ncbi:carboxymethylenebutenolidase homolog isoform X1 [Dioscorea cayenensis subsp. rotundata]|uniref:Carboxymethylenebutenolidase homolog n=1 Tax=Dioscorea cayennensis subsp. rotundata TaxID=55577 RepID=A0AB40B7V2_DIOCR|nr:carboxymethylenebutenolidase homolog isoform X1 [Dioscorea cayenensis subsp. rotundata]
MASSSSTLFFYAAAPLHITRPTPPARLCHSALNFSGKCILYNQTCLFHTEKSTGRVLCSKVQFEDNVVGDNDDDEACELVNGAEIVIEDGEESIHAYLLKAIKNNNGTGLLLLSDVFGFEDSATRDFAYRVACSGYNVLVPDMFRGNPRKIDQPMTDFEQWLAKQPPERIARDINMAAKWLADEFTAAGFSNKLGIIGFCYGGGCLINTLAQDKQGIFGTGVCFYGTRIDTSVAKDIKVPVLFVCGDGDHLCPVSQLRELEKIIKGSKMVIYNGRGHGFAHRPGSLEEDEDAEDAFGLMRSWLNDSLVLSKDLVH